MNTEDFLNKFSFDSAIKEFVIIWKNWAKIVSKEYALKTKKDNVYFLSWVRKDMKYWLYNRAKDIDIIVTNKIAIDIDLRKQYENKYKEKITDEEIIKQWEYMVEYMIWEHEYLWDYDFIVFSWNGLHIYYLWEPRNISPDDYSYAMDRIMREWDNFWGDEVMYSDKACKNISRIFRLPWSINQKTWKECFVIKERQGSWKLFNSIEILARVEKQQVLAKKEEENRIKIEEYIRQEKMNRLIKWSKYEEDKEKLQRLFNNIDSIPINLVVEKINPMFPLSKNWKNFDNEKWWFCWYYVVKELNSVCNGGSQYFNWGGINSCWSPSVLIKHQYNLTWNKTIQYFKDNFWIKS